VAKIKPLTKIADKWADVTPGRSSDYEAGVKDTSVDWAGPTATAEDAWSDGVSAAAANKRFSAGVNKAGTAKWRRKAVEVGVSRWGPGVRAAKDDYKTGFEPYHRVIEGVTLPPRFSRGDPRNIDRVATIASALHEEKVRGT